jgi:hypothetical protein
VDVALERKNKILQEEDLPERKIEVFLLLFYT